MIATANAGLAIHESEAQLGKEFPGMIANPDECKPVNVSGDVDATPTNFRLTFYVRGTPPRIRYRNNAFCRLCHRVEIPPVALP